jgi:hypothetical protein
MVRFELVTCSVMICVSDLRCMRFCAAAGFPCLYFDFYSSFSPLVYGTDTGENFNRNVSAMEQVAHLKLFHLPLALRRGVSLLLLDLDVGFTQDPFPLIHSFIDAPHVDVMVQEDITFIMDRTPQKWKHW